MKEILFGLLLLLLIPLKSYSFQSIQDDSLTINRKQMVSILKDRRELEYRRELNKQDSLLIKEYKGQILAYKEQGDSYEFLLRIKQDTIDSLRRKNKVILITSGILIGGTVYLMSK